MRMSSAHSTADAARQQQGSDFNGRDQVEKLYNSSSSSAAAAAAPDARLWTKFKWRDKLCDAMIVLFKFLSALFSFN